MDIVKFDAEPRRLPLLSWKRIEICHGNVKNVLSVIKNGYVIDKVDDVHFDQEASEELPLAPEVVHESLKLIVSVDEIVAVVVYPSFLILSSKRWKQFLFWPDVDYMAGRVLDVRWVTNSLRAVKVVWKMFEALCNHFSSALSDTNKDDLKDEYMTQATVALNDMSFKNIKLVKNSKLVNINHDQFLTSLVDNLNARLFDKEQDTLILQDMQIMDTIEWPVDYNINYGKDKINRLCKRFQLNKNDAINGLRKKIDDQNISFKNVMPELYNFINTFPCSTAEYERGFNLMNNICKKF
ncbi:Hypothetical protein CINCED_3A004881 [Cinara cedri]|uniref:Uncharacterized protein n=1 Tax=Cinara cedri TaxID=506608 RepID=A0A5E4MWC6_9HEMI|nr:Hypothetical protein CINCED_3A004881 [Cinara cedri]